MLAYITRLSFFISLVWIQSMAVYADQEVSQSFAEGQGLASSSIAGIEQGVKNGDPTLVPGYAGINVPEVNFDDAKLKGISAASPEVVNNEAANVVIDSHKQQSLYKFDSVTDPLIVQGDEIVNNPEKVIGGQIYEKPDTVQETIEQKTCEESGDETLEECEENRLITAPKLKKSIRCYIYSHGWGLGLSRNVVTGIQYDGTTSNTRAYAAGVTIYDTFPAELKNRVYKVAFAEGFNPPISLSSDGTLSVNTAGGSRSRDFGYWREVGPYAFTVDVYYKAGDEDIKEEEKSNCQYLEQRVDQGLCTYEDIIDIEGPETRIINDYVAKRDWWKRKKVYQCKYPAANDCDPLRAKGCYQIGSDCKQKIGNVCVVWQQTYECKSGKKTGYTYYGSGDQTFCLGGDCVDQSYLANNEFGEVVSKLTVIKEAGESFNKFGSIFQGQKWGCNRHCIDFKDCCGSSTGWGVTFKLGTCGADEIQLRDLRNQKLCTQVGTYCAEKVPGTGICWRKKTTFCCFGNKLSRTIQEQGRRQLKIDFGTPENPQCRGLTINELTSLDFSQIDFSELVGDIIAKTSVPDGQTLTQSIQQSMIDRGSVLKNGQPVPMQSKPLRSNELPKRNDNPEQLIQGRKRGEF